MEISFPHTKGGDNSILLKMCNLFPQKKISKCSTQKIYESWKTMINHKVSTFILPFFLLFFLAGREENSRKVDTYWLIKESILLQLIFGLIQHACLFFNQTKKLSLSMMHFLDKYIISFSWKLIWILDREFLNKKKFNFVRTYLKMLIGQFVSDLFECWRLLNEIFSRVFLVLNKYRETTICIFNIWLLRQSHPYMQKIQSKLVNL